jgi:hypothetical protein
VADLDLGGSGILGGPPVAREAALRLLGAVTRPGPRAPDWLAGLVDAAWSMAWDVCRCHDTSSPPPQPEREVWNVAAARNALGRLAAHLHELAEAEIGKKAAGLQTVAPGDDKGGRPSNEGEENRDLRDPGSRGMSAPKEERLRAILRAPEIAQDQDARPRWCAEKRELRLGDRPPRQYGAQATRQAAVLAAFEALGWPEAIDNPLRPPEALKHTVAGLNDTLCAYGLRFTRLDGGARVGWSPVTAAQARPA